MIANNADKLLTDVADVQLPVLAATKRLFDEIAERPATGHVDLARLAENDPGLALALFRELTASERRPAEPITSLPRVISLLGVDSFRSVLRRTPTLEERFLGPGQKGLKAAYGRAILAASLARMLATMRGKLQLDEDATAALLQNLGELILWAKKPGTMSVIGEAAYLPEQRDAKGLKRYGICPSQIGETFAIRWALPDAIVRAQRYHNSFDANSQLPLLAATLAWACSKDWNAETCAELIELAADFTHLDTDLVSAQIHRQAAVAARAAHQLHLPHSADRLLAIAAAESAANQAAAGMPPESARPAPPEPGPDAARRSAPKPAAEPVPAPTASPAAPVKSAAAARPGPAPAQAAPANPLQHRISVLLQQLRQETGLRRIMFAMLTPDKTRIRARFVQEAEKSDLNEFNVATKSRNLFALLVHKAHALWINSGNQVKYLPYIPEEAAGLLDAGGFFAVSVVVKGQPIGVLYGDGSHLTMTAENFAAIKQGTQRLAAVFKAP